MEWNISLKDVHQFKALVDLIDQFLEGNVKAEAPAKWQNSVYSNREVI